MWIAPRLLVTEVAAALRRKVIARVLQSELALQAMESFRRIVEEGALHFAADELLASEALILALRTKHKVPDCLYLALAQREAGSLATADRVLARLAELQNVVVHCVRSA